MLAEELRAGLFDAGEAQPNQAPIHGVRDLLAKPTDFLGRIKVVGFIVADLAASAEAFEGGEGGEHVSEGVVAHVGRRPHEDWRVELEGELIDEEAIVRAMLADHADVRGGFVEQVVDGLLGGGALVCEEHWEEGKVSFCSLCFRMRSTCRWPGPGPP